MLLNRANLVGVAGFVSDDITRANMAGVHVTPQCTVATNGHALAIVTVPNTSEDEFPSVEGLAAPNGTEFTPRTLDADDVRRLAKALPTAKQATRLPLPVLACARLDNAVAAPEWIAATCPGGDISAKTVHRGTALDGGAFPDWTQVVPKDEPTLSVHLNARYLRAACDAVIASGMGGNASMVTLELRRDQPVVLRAKNTDTGQEATYVIMFMRG